MSRFSRVVVLEVIVAAGGVATAFALVQPGNAMQLPPVTTVSVPTLPTPPPPVAAVPVPAPAPTPVPAPPLPSSPPSVATPPVTTPATAGAPTASPARVPAAPSAAAAAGPAPTTWSNGERRAERSSATPRSGGLRARPHRERNRVGVRLEFTLARAERVFLIVRGPAPSCRVAGVIPFRGRKGANSAQFSGRVGGRPLARGVYLITVSPTRARGATAPTQYVRVVSQRRSVPLADSVRKPSCRAVQALGADPAVPMLLREVHTTAGGPAARPVAPLRPPLQRPDDRLSNIVPDPRTFAASASEGDLEAAATIEVITIIGGLLLLMLGLVTRFLRGTWNP